MRRIVCWLVGHDVRIVGMLRSHAAWRQCTRCKVVVV